MHTSCIGILSPKIALQHSELHSISSKACVCSRMCVCVLCSVTSQKSPRQARCRIKKKWHISVSIWEETGYYLGNIPFRRKLYAMCAGHITSKCRWNVIFDQYWHSYQMPVRPAACHYSLYAQNPPTSLKSPSLALRGTSCFSTFTLLSICRPCVILVYIHVWRCKDEEGVLDENGPDNEANPFLCIRGLLRRVWEKYTEIHTSFSLSLLLLLLLLLCNKTEKKVLTCAAAERFVEGNKYL